MCPTESATYRIFVFALKEDLGLDDDAVWRLCAPEFACPAAGWAEAGGAEACGAEVGGGEAGGAEDGVAEDIGAGAGCPDGGKAVLLFQIIEFQV